MADQIKRPQTVDGFPWNEAQDAEMDRICATVLAKPDGQQLLAYLKRISVNNVQGPNVGRDQLLHLEGQRFIVAVLESRMANWTARMKQQTEKAQPKSAPKKGAKS